MPVLVGKLVLHGIGHLVNEPNDNAGMSAVLVFYSLAFLALAELEVVVLRETIDAVGRILAHELHQPCLAYLHHLRV